MISINSILAISCPVGGGSRIHRLYFCREVRIFQRVSRIYDIKQSNGEVAVMLELWGMHDTPSLPPLPGPLYPGVVASDSVLSMGQIFLIIAYRSLYSASSSSSSSRYGDNIDSFNSPSLSIAFGTFTRRHPVSAQSG